MKNQQVQTHKQEEGDLPSRQEQHRNQRGRQQYGDKRLTVPFKTIVPVHKDYVGAVIGKGGAMINQIKNDTETRISYMDHDFSRGHQSPIFQITGSQKGVGRAENWVRRILQSTWQAEQEETPVDEAEGQDPTQESV